jgi:hypothetical protein
MSSAKNTGCAIASLISAGITLVVLAVIGIIVNAVYGAQEGLVNALEFEWVHNVVHVALAAVALWIGFSRTANAGTARTVAVIFGVAFLLLAFLGIVSEDALAFMGIHLEWVENLYHLALGAWGLYAGLTHPNVRRHGASMR